MMNVVMDEGVCEKANEIYISFQPKWWKHFAHSALFFSIDKILKNSFFSIKFCFGQKLEIPL